MRKHKASLDINKVSLAYYNSSCVMTFFFATWNETSSLHIVKCTDSLLLNMHFQAGIKKVKLAITRYNEARLQAYTYNCTLCSDKGATTLKSLWLCTIVTRKVYHVYHTLCQHSLVKSRQIWWFHVSTKLPNTRRQQNVLNTSYTTACELLYAYKFYRNIVVG